MPPELGRADFVAMVEAMKATIAEAMRQPPAEWLKDIEAMKHIGVSRSVWFRLKSAGELPRPATLPQGGERWSRKQLDEWMERQKRRRK